MRPHHPERRCPSCGAPVADPRRAFCERCGAVLPADEGPPAADSAREATIDERLAQLERDPRLAALRAEPAPAGRRRRGRLAPLLFAVGVVAIVALAVASGAAPGPGLLIVPGLALVGVALAVVRGARRERELAARPVERAAAAVLAVRARQRPVDDYDELPLSARRVDVELALAGGARRAVVASEKLARGLAPGAVGLAAWRGDALVEFRALG